MRSTTLRLGRSRLKSDMTTNNSGCVCETMEKALMQPFYLGKGLRGTTACPACGNAPN